MNLSQWLQHLRILLGRLSDTIPEGREIHNFIGFLPDPTEIEYYGTAEAVVNHALEISFAPLGRNSGSWPFRLKDILSDKPLRAAPTPRPKPAPVAADAADVQWSFT